MAAPVQPVPSPSASGTPTPPTPTPTPAPSPTPAPIDPLAGTPFAGMTQEEKDRMLLVSMQTIREQGSTLNRVTAEIDELKRPPAPQPKDDAKLLFEDPRKLVREEVNAAIAPLKEFITGMRSGTALEQLKAVKARDPRFKAILEDPILSHEVDVAMSKADVNDRNLELVIAGVSGAANLGMIPGWRPSAGAPAPAAPAAPAPGALPVAVPPHIPPSAGPGPGAPSPAPKIRELTENERRLAREMKMSPEQYVAWTDLSAPDVPFADRTKIDRTAAAK